MDFSWFGITAVDIGVVSVGVIGFAWVFRRMTVLERENGALRAQVNALEQENGRLRVQVDTLEQENGRLRVQVNTLEQEINALKQENQEFRHENRELRKDLEVLAGRYAEIKEVLVLILKRENFSDSGGSDK